jgi:hypothetical protein
MKFFKPEDFPYSSISAISNGAAVSSYDIADRANQLLAERGTVVYGNLNNNMQGNWSEDIESTFIKANSNHKALLINIEPIEPARGCKIL